MLQDGTQNKAHLIEVAQRTLGLVRNVALPRQNVLKSLHAPRCKQCLGKQPIPLTVARLSRDFLVRHDRHVHVQHSPDVHAVHEVHRPSADAALHPQFSTKEVIYAMFRSLSPLTLFKDVHQFSVSSCEL